VSFAEVFEEIYNSECTGRQTDSYNKSNWCLVFLIERKGVFPVIAATGERGGVQFEANFLPVFFIFTASILATELKGGLN
jgi:hypothetical protein